MSTFRPKRSSREEPQTTLLAVTELWEIDECSVGILIHGAKNMECLGLPVALDEFDSAKSLDNDSSKDKKQNKTSSHISDKL